MRAVAVTGNDRDLRSAFGEVECLVQREVEMEAEERFTDRLT